MSEEHRHDPEPSCCFDAWVPAWEHKSKRRATIAGVTAPLLDALVEAGIEGRTVLDVGCGIGDLSMAALGRGAERATGIELSPKAIEVGTAIALERGLQDRMTFRAGDGSKVDLPSADVVVLNRVVCCYPDIESLVSHSLAAARSVYAFTAPPSSGIAGAFVRVFGWFSNGWYRLRERKFRGFRVFVHDIDRIDERVRAAGFHPVRRERQRLVWHLAVYTR